VSGTSNALESLEPILHQDLNGDGTIGPLATTTIEAIGSTYLSEVANHFYLNNSAGSGPSLKLHGTDVVAGQFDFLAAWAPIGAEQTASGYDVAWKVTGADQYTVWSTDSSGNYISNIIGFVSGTSNALESLEPILHQDLNGDGHIGPAAAAITGNADTFVFNLPAIGQVRATDFTHAADLLDISSGAAPPHPGIEDYFTTGNAGAPPVDLNAGLDGHTPAIALHHQTDFHLI
jgi:hypothetical protein